MYVSVIEISSLFLVVTIYHAVAYRKSHRSQTMKVSGNVKQTQQNYEARTETE